MADIIGTTGDDTITGTPDADNIQGLEGNDTINGGAGDDMLFGGDGNDLVSGNAGNDLVDGGSGDDNVQDASDGNDIIRGGAGNDLVAIQRSTASPVGTVQLEGNDGNDRFSIFVENASTTTVDGGAGDDEVVVLQARGPLIITLGSGRDAVTINSPFFAMQVAPTVTDFVEGNAGDRINLDTIFAVFLLNWDGATNPFATGHLRVLQDGADTLVQVDRDGGGNSFISVLRLADVTAAALTASNLGGYDPAGGASAALSVVGTGSDEILTGNAGADIINGGDGADLIFGGSGNDFINGGAGNDRLFGETGDDVIDGGDGDDVISDNARGFDIARGGAGNDTISVSRSAIHGGSATIEGGSGNDTISVSLGRAISSFDLAATASIDAGDGSDIVRISQTGGGVVVTLGAGQDVLDLNNLSTSNPFLTITDFATGATGDRIVWDAFLRRVLTGWDQVTNPFTIGFLELSVDEDNPTTTVLAINGGAFFGVIRFADTPANQFTAFNLGGYSSNLGEPVAGTEGGDTLDGTAGADNLLGLGGNDTLRGFDGDDILDGGAGNDQLLGGLGDDTLVGGTGADRMEGGEGADIYEVDNPGDAVIEAFDPLADEIEDVVILRLDTFAVPAGIERVEYVGTGFATITGNDEDNRISLGGDQRTPGAVGSTIFGLGGNDGIVGGSGIDVILGGSGIDEISGQGGNDIIYGGDDRDGIVGNEGDDFISGGAGNDNIEGDFGQPFNSTEGNDAIDAGEGDDIASGNGGDDIILGGDGNDLLYGETQFVSTVGGNDRLIGGAGDDRLFGGGGNDALSGGDGADLLDGGAGIDYLDGGSGDDLYVIDPGDAVIESENGGIDSITGNIASIGLPEHVENFTASGIGAFLANAFVAGNALANRIQTGPGNTIVVAGGGDDVVSSDIFFNANDNFQGGDGDDQLFGGGGNDYLNGGAGADRLDGGAGSDTLEGGDGNDILLGDTTSLQAPDILLGGAGDDFLDGGPGGGDLMVGGDGNDTIIADLNDRVSAGAGADMIDARNSTRFNPNYLEGGAGDDIYIVGTNADSIVEAVDGGIDTVRSADTLIGLRPNVENFLYIGTDAAAAFGNELDNLIDVSASARALALGGDGADILIGGVGNDNLQGGLGNDTLNGGAGDDSLNGGAGVNTLDGGIGNDSLEGGEDSDTLIGSDGNDILLGNGGVDDLNGGAGNDRLIGGAGNDSVAGGAGDDSIGGGDGNDTLNGGAGSDYIEGGAGADIYAFADADGAIDSVIGFNRAGGDTIDLSGIDANEALPGNQAFTFVGAAAFSGVAGELRAFTRPAGSQIVEGDTDGDGVADFVIFVSLGSTTIGAADIIL